MDIETCIRSRRSHHAFDGTPVPRQTLLELAELLRWAPNHRLTQPWRCIALDADGVQALGQHLITTSEDASLDPEMARRCRLCGERKLAAVGGMLVVSCVHDADPDRHREDQQAVAAGVQNILLAATAHGLASFWSTGRPFQLASTQTWLGMDPTRELLIAAIWLGGVATLPEAPPRQDVGSYLRWLE
ncbi:MAG: nitroreductase family protein [Planctomycetota bacterium]